MRTHRCRGFTLIELIVLVFVIAVLMAIVVNVLQAQRGCGCGRRTQCANNMRNIGLALVVYQTTKNRLPDAGTFYDDPALNRGDPFRSNIYRAIIDPGTNPEGARAWLRSWVVEILPYFDNQDIYNAWNFQESYLSTGETAPSGWSNAQLTTTGIGVLRCPDDYTAAYGQGNLSYVVNGGFVRWHAVPVGWSGSRIDGKATSGEMLRWTPPGGTWKDSQAVCKQLGVMFLGTHTSDQPWDVATTPADITDGLSHTLLVAENTLAGYSKGTRYSGGWETNWACPLPNFAMFLASDDVCRTARSAGDCLGGQLAPDPKWASGKGWSRANRKGTFEDINFGQRLTVEGSFPFANSAHSCGANFVFCDGAVRFLSSSIDGTVYAELITPAGMRLPSEIRQGVLDADAFAD
jgi:prepilin-type N-terminal cleavage/methylation domain-containing protein/prepilin-type processing-associated H-X9-DG protein